MLRLIELKILDDKYPVSQIVDLIRKLEVTSSGENKFVNNAVASPFITFLCKEFNLKINHYFFNEKELDNLYKMRFLR